MRKTFFSIITVMTLFASSGCSPSASPVDTSTAESTATTVETEESQDAEEAVPVESCLAIDDLASYLSGVSGPGDDATLVAWVVGLKNRFEQDPESELTPDFDAFRNSITELFEAIRSYGDGTAEDLGLLKADIENKLVELDTELDQFLEICSLPTLEARSDRSGIELGDFWATGFWVDLTSQNSLGDTSFQFSQLHFDESRDVTVVASLFCFPWVREDNKPMMMLAASNDSYPLPIEEVYDGAIRARIDDKDPISWTGDFEYPYFYKIWDDQMNLLFGAERMAIQMIVDDSAFDFSLDLLGTSVIWDQFRTGGCDF